jgi:hypothetical protein
MNVWSHREVNAEAAENGGKVPDGLKSRACSAGGRATRANTSGKARKSDRLPESKTTIEALIPIRGNLHELVLRNSLDPRFARKLA